MYVWEREREEKDCFLLLSFTVKSLNPFTVNLILRFLPIFTLIFVSDDWFRKVPATAYHMIAKELLINLAINMLPSNQTTNHFLIRILFISAFIDYYKYILWLFRSNTKIWLLIDLQPAYNLKNVHFLA